MLRAALAVMKSGRSARAFGPQASGSAAGGMEPRLACLSVSS